MKTQKVEYKDGEETLEGYCAYISDNIAKKPAILVCHDWSGRNDFACHKAEQLAELGYIGFALDMYGKGKVGTTNEEKTALMQPFIQDRQKITKRMHAALHTLEKLPNVNTSKIGAIGFCFGGLCVLDLARSGADVKGVVSFHGLLEAPAESSSNEIKSKVLALHGYDDPLVTPDKVMAFGNEMTHAKVDWQLHMYGHTKHSFTNPQAHDEAAGLVFNKSAEKRSWISMQNFFKEIFLI